MLSCTLVEASAFLCCAHETSWVTGSVCAKMCACLLRRIYWMNPLQYITRAILINEFTAGQHSTFSPDIVPCLHVLCMLPTLSVCHRSHYSRSIRPTEFHADMNTVRDNTASPEVSLGCHMSWCLVCRSLAKQAVPIRRDRPDSG